jgi:hypothetical protein
VTSWEGLTVYLYVQTIFYFAGGKPLEEENLTKLVD